MSQSERDFRRQWAMMQQVLGAEAQGKRPHAINSTRTLFGIKSHVEEVMEAVAAEDLARAQERIEKEKILASNPIICQDSQNPGK